MLEIFKERKIVNNALKNPSSLAKISEEDRNNKKIFNRIFDKMKEYENLMPIITVCNFMGEKLKNDKDFMLKNILERKFFFAFDYATEELKNNREFVFEIVKETKDLRIISNILNYGENEIKNDRDFLLKICKEVDSPFILKNFNELRNDKSFVSELIKEKGNVAILGYAGEKIRNDKEFVFELIKMETAALIWAGEEISNDKDFIFKAIKETKEPELIYCYAGDELRNNKDFIFKAIKETENPLILKYAPEKLRNDRDFVFKLSEENPTISLNSEVVGKGIMSEVASYLIKEKVEKYLTNSSIEELKIIKEKVNKIMKYDEESYYKNIENFKKIGNLEEINKLALKIANEITELKYFPASGFKFNKEVDIRIEKLRVEKVKTERLETLIKETVEKDISKDNYNALTGNRVIVENHSSGEKRWLAVADVKDKNIFIKENQTPTLTVTLDKIEEKLYAKPIEYYNVSQLNITKEIEQKFVPMKEKEKVVEKARDKGIER